MESLAENADGVYLHFDLDALDPAEATWNRWPVPGGLAIQSVRETISTIASFLPIKAIGLASYDPTVDQHATGLGAALKIVESALNNVHRSGPDPA